MDTILHTIRSNNTSAVPSIVQQPKLDSYEFVLQALREEEAQIIHRKMSKLKSCY